MAGNPQRRSRGGFNQRDNKNFNNNMNNNSGNMSGRIEFRFLIPSRAASIIIGKGGERIQRLRHECNARLSIPDNHGPERVFVLESTMENCIKVWADCFPELKDVMSGSFNMDSRRGPGSFRDDSEIDLRFLVHDSLVGAVIGKGGVNVKNLRLQYHLSIVKVFPSTAPLSSDRIIQIVGKFENMFDCFRAIYQTLEGQNIKGNIENYNAANSDDNLVSSYGGWGANQGGFENSNRKSNPPLLGSNERNLPQNGRFNNKPAPNDQFFSKPDMGRGNNLPKPLLNNRFDNFANDNFKNDIDRDNFPKQQPFNNRMPSSSFEQNYPGVRKRMNSNNDSDMNNDINKRGRMRMNNFEPRNENFNNNNNNFNNNRPNNFDPRNDNRNNFFDNRNDNKPMNRNDNPMGRGPPLINNVPPANNLPFSEKVEVLIPTTLMHAIRGYDSDILMNISNDSGADINIVNMDDEHNPDAIVSLSGTKDQIEGAQYLLQICIKKSVLNL